MRLLISPIVVACVTLTVKWRFDIVVNRRAVALTSLSYFNLTNGIEVEVMFSLAILANFLVQEHLVKKKTHFELLHGLVFRKFVQVILLQGHLQLQIPGQKAAV